jgi:hypothetical protein
LLSDAAIPALDDSHRVSGGAVVNPRAGPTDASNIRRIAEQVIAP